MLRMTDGRTTGTAVPELGYISARGPLGRAALRLTRWLRATNAERYLGPAERHLDIGCGDGYLLRRSQATERIGLDRLLGDEATDGLPFPSEHFDQVTMLAVIEHIRRPEPLVAEIARVLKPGGRFVLTTPRREAETLIRLYVRGIEDEHERYLTRADIEGLAGGSLRIVASHSFIFGLNQCYCLEKPDRKSTRLNSSH